MSINVKGNRLILKNVGKIEQYERKINLNSDKKRFLDSSGIEITE
ncbi:MAG: hypothetical protein AB1608_08080 [Thermoproteota archaeon]